MTGQGSLPLADPIFQVQSAPYLNTSTYTGNDGYSGDLYSGNDGYSGLNPPDDAILFTVSGITAIADKKCENLIKKIDF